jgi:uncharacterized protein
VKRLLYNELVEWKNKLFRMPLLLRGARQVGKTHLVRQLGETFKNFIEINFERNPELIKIFDHDLDPVRIIKELGLILNKVIKPGNTLLFFDEIQESDKIVLALRYFYEDMPQLHVIAAGSLVDFAIERVGVPVGRISFLHVYPLSFIEFLAAKGLKNLALEIIQHGPTKPLNDAIHEKALRLAGEYMAIGGMPQAVNQWVNQQDVQLTTTTLQNIKNAYEQDFAKYAKKNAIKYVDLLFQQIPRLICQRFKYSNLTTSFRKRELEPALYLLEKAGIFHQVNHSHGNGIPLGAEADPDKFKLIALDIGLGQTILGLELKEWFIDSAAALINKGSIAENFVGQELLAYSNSLDKQSLYFWLREGRGSNAEVDYLIIRNQQIIPVEVKSGHGAGLQSLRVFLNSHLKSSYGIRFSIHNYSVFNQVHSYPLYAVAGAIENKERLLNFLEKN